MKKIPPIVLVFSLLFGGVCLRLFGSGMAMDSRMPSGHAVAAQAQHLACCEVPHQEGQKIMAVLAPALGKIQVKIFVPLMWLVAVTLISFQLLSFGFQEKKKIFVVSGPPDLTGSIIKRE